MKRAAAFFLGLLATLSIHSAVKTPGSAGVNPGSVINSQLASMAANTLKGNATGSLAAPQDLSVAQALALITSTSGGGTTNYLNAAGGFTTPPGAGVTSVGLSIPGIFTVTNSPVTGAGILTATPAGTSGGIPYFSSTTSLASSAALTANAIVLGGGAGVAPTVVSSLGTTTSVLHGNASGPAAWGPIVSADLPAAISGFNISINKNSNFTTEIGDGTTTSNITIGNPANTTVFGSPLSLGNGAVSAASWTTNGIGLTGTATTFTDTTGSGTIATEAAYAFPAATIAATTAATTITNLAELYLPIPAAGTNVTGTNLWSLMTAGGIKVSGAVNIGGGTVTIAQNSNNIVNLGTGTNNQLVTIGGGANAVTLNATTLTLGGSTLVTSSSPTTLSNATVKLSGLATSSAAQTGTVCSGTAGLLTVDTTTTCLLSDIRLKKNIKPLDVGLAEVMKLKPISYELKPEANPTHLGRQVGLSAQDVYKVDPRLAAVYQSGPNINTPSGVRYEQMVALLVKAMQEQQTEINALKRQIKARH